MADSNSSDIEILSSPESKVHDIWEDLAGYLLEQSTEVLEQSTIIQQVSDDLQGLDYFELDENQRTGQMNFLYSTENHLTAKSVRTKLFSLYFAVTRARDSARTVQLITDQKVDKLKHIMNVILASPEVSSDKESTRRIKTIWDLINSEIETSSEYTAIVSTIERASNMLEVLKPTIDYLLKQK